MPLVIIELLIAFLAPSPFQLLALPIAAIAMTGLLMGEDEKA